MYTAIHSLAENQYFVLHKWNSFTNILVSCDVDFDIKNFVWMNVRNIYECI